MCGIFGFTGFREEMLNTARAALHTLHHRGPDQWNDHYDAHVYLGHQRLSILDLSENGKQPMTDAEQLVHITVNGEIYNHLRLRDQLKDRYHFRSTSDSEVILHGYLEWGIEGLLERLEGMYAFVIHDSRTGEVFLARDRAGIKPLFYGILNGQVCWASELKAIKRLYSDTGALAIDHTAVYDFLTYLYVPTPKSLYKDVFKLEPGHYLRINVHDNSVVKKQYWKLGTDDCGDGLPTAANKVYELVRDSVNEQMMADVPVGFFLSGGMDSSVVVSMAARQHQNLRTFSIGFENKRKDESGYADLVASANGTRHVNRVISDDDIADMFERIVDWYDEPNALSSSYPNYMVSSLAREQCVVALTGDGGDEVFGGYNWYKGFEWFSGKRPSSGLPFRGVLRTMRGGTRLLDKVINRAELYLLNDDMELYTRLMGGMLKCEKTTYREQWGIPADYDDYWYFRTYYQEELPLFKRLQYLDFHTFLPDACLAKVDRTSMAVSLECRVPLLSTPIIEYCFSLSDDVRLHRGELKAVMKTAFKDVLPTEILNRDKRGFSAPLAGVFRKLNIEGGQLPEYFLNHLWKDEIGG
jgi:asparagine synthase (glutamine-hydrolysing)